MTDEGLGFGRRQLIENIIENHELIKMNDFAKSVDKFLKFNEFKVLGNKGKISQKRAKDKALKEYKTFNKTQKISVNPISSRSLGTTVGHLQRPTTNGAITSQKRHELL